MATWPAASWRAYSLGLAYEEHRQAEAEAGVGETEEERRRAQAPALGDVSGGEGGDGDGAVAGCLVEAHREPASRRPDEIDLHHDRGRPGESLVDAEQHVGEHHPSPGGGPHEQQRDGQGEDPPGDQDRFAAEPVGECAGEEIRRCLHGTEGDDEGERRGEGGEPELASASSGRTVRSWPIMPPTRALTPTSSAN